MRSGCCGVELRDPSEVSAAFAVISSSNSGITALDFEKREVVEGGKRIRRILISGGRSQPRQ
jgi:hypothetical protein